MSAGGAGRGLRHRGGTRKGPLPTMQLQLRRHRPSIPRKNRNCLPPPAFSSRESRWEANEKDKGKQMTLFQIQPQLGLYHVEFNSKDLLQCLNDEL